MLEFEENITEKMILDNPQKIFVFGDNLERKGKGGQAKICRGKVNCFGIPTKRKPKRTEDAYFSNKDAIEVYGLLSLHFSTLRQKMSAGQTVVWPAYGIGTGMADLPARAPAIYKLIYQWMMDLVAEFGFSGYYLGPKPQKE